MNARKWFDRIGQLTVFVGLLIVYSVLPADAADTTPLSARQANSLVRDGATPDSPSYHLLIGGIDSNGTAQSLLIDTTGSLQVDLTGTATYAGNADNVTEPASGELLGVASFGFAYNATGDNFDRIRIDDSANLLVALGTNLDYTNDSVTAYGSIPDNAAVTDGTTRGMPMMGYYDDTIGTALTENDGAIVRINALRAQVGTIEDGDTRAIYADVETAGADNHANTLNGLWTYSAAIAYDAINSDWGRIRQSQLDGFYTPDAANTLVITANGGEDCTADNALTAGNVYIVQSDGRLPCVMGADAATIAADASDMPVESPGLYQWRATSTKDTICCVAAAGTITVHITPVDFN